MRQRSGSGLVIAVALAIAFPAPAVSRAVAGQSHPGVDAMASPGAPHAQAAKKKKCKKGYKKVRRHGKLKCKKKGRSQAGGGGNPQTPPPPATGDRGAAGAQQIPPRPAGDDGGGPTIPPSEPDTAPNIVFILTDDQRYDTVTPELMPNVWSSLVEPGLTFTNAFVTRSACCPSRASMLTGQYAHNTGVLFNSPSDLDGDGDADGGFQAFDDASTLATWMSGAGYRTGLIGKYLNGYGGTYGYQGKRTGWLYVPPGWDTFRTFNSGEAYYNYFLNIDGRRVAYHPEYTSDPGGSRTFHPENYSTTVLADHALDFIGSSSFDDRPFFLMFAPYAPHQPSDPAPGDENELPGLAKHRPPSFDEDDVSDKPAWVQGLRREGDGGEQEDYRVDDSRLKQLRATLAVDRAVRDIVERLRQLGELDDTLIVFTSDHGLMWEEHRITVAKENAYEESIRVPLVVRGPGVARGTTSLLAANIDIAPTFAEVAKATPDIPADGRSLRPIFTGTPGDWRNDLLVEHWRDPAVPDWLVNSPPSFLALRTDDHKYVEYDAGERELYDLRSDPYELQSIAADPAQTDLVQRLSARLTSLATCAGETCRTDADQPGHN